MLDVKLPDADGWTVLDRLKHNPATRHIPVQIMSGVEDWQRGIQLGAIGFMKKPIEAKEIKKALDQFKGLMNPETKRKLLVVEDDKTQRESIVDLIAGEDVEITAVENGEETLKALKQDRFHCMVLDLGLPDMPGFQLVEKIKNAVDLRELPIIVYTGRDLTRIEKQSLKKLTEAVVIKDVNSPERLFDKTALYLHRVHANLPEAKRDMLERLYQTDPILAGQKVLVVDDDVRNIFALTSVLERQKMKVVYAERGKDGLKILQGTQSIDVVLMDVMMPEMDGYETMREIRKLSRFRVKI
jgi:CheY-like chemotaxis protein